VFDDAHAPTDAHETALACLDAAIDAATPETVIPEAVRVEDGSLRVGDEPVALDDFDRVLVLGGGKATGGVADELEAVLGDRIDDGAVVVPADEALGGDADNSRIERLPGDHPVPSERGVESARRVVELAAGADDRTLVLAVVTGGASALLPAPADGVTLEDLRATTEALLASGASIHELNAVRKHLSALKGGRLAAAAAPATVVGVVFSDVVGDDLSVIGSGPTAPDESTYADALDVLDRYDLAVPEAVRDRLERGAAGDLPETPNPDDPSFDRVRNVILVNGFRSLTAAREAADERGYDACLLSSRVRGESRESAVTHVAVAEEVAASGNPVEPPAVLLSGGETTVTVTGDGEGGPNLEFALSAAVELSGGDAGTVAASVDSDGRDGGTDVAGAIVDESTASDRNEARDALDRNDALGFLEDRDVALRTGATGTNVDDLRVFVVPDTAGSR
jgi:hydroxypyruvate reductase